MGLGADASDEVIANSVQSFQTEMVQYKEVTDSDIVRLENSNASLTTQSASLTADNLKLTNANKSILGQLVDNDMITHKDVIANEADVREMLLNDREGGLKLLNGLKLAKPTPPPTPPKPAPLHNASLAAHPAPVVDGGNKVTEEFAIKITNRARELQSSNKGMGWNMAFLNARAECEANLQN